MAERSVSRLWAMRALFLGFGVLIPLYYMLPLSLMPRNWAPPDVILALGYAWAVRRPEYVPVLALVAVFLIGDFLLQRPPGLWAALALMALEWAKSREYRQVETTFVLEWLTFALVVVAITVAYRAVLMLVVVSPGALYLAVIQAAMTVAIYPLVVLLSRFILSIRRTAPGEIDSFG